MSTRSQLVIRLGLGTLLSVAPASAAHAQNAVSGAAFGVSAQVQNVGSIAPDPSVVLPPDGGSTEAHLANVFVPGLVGAETLDATSSGSIGVSSASATSRAAIENLDVLAGLVTADVLVSQAACGGNGVTATCNDAGTTFLNVAVAGVPIVGQPPPNTVIAVPGIATVILNEHVVGGNGTTTASLTVNAVHVILLGGLGEVVVSSAHSDVDLQPLADDCLCPQPDDSLSGEAFGSSVDILMVQVGKNPHAVLADQGGNAQAQALESHVATVLDTGTVTATTTGSLLPGSGTSASDSVVQSLDILGGIISADVVQAQATCTGNGITASCSSAGTTFVNLSVLGLPVNLLPPPNTVIALPLIGTLILNEQIAGGNGTTTASLTVNLIHVQVASLLLGTGDIIVASADAGVDVSPENVCPNPCDDGNPCDGVEVCDQFDGCGPGTPLPCDDQNACNGVESCDSATGCMLGIPLVCNDGNVCDGVETCNPQVGCVTGQPLACDDGDPCTGQETCDPTDGCQPGIPQCPGVPGCLVQRVARVKDGSLVIGNFGVNSPIGQVNFGQEVFMPDGTTLFGNLVKLRNGVSVFNVLANDLRVGKDVSIRGTTGAPVLPVQDPFCPIPDGPCGTQDVIVAKNGTAPALAPGTYRLLAVMNGASIELAPGVFQFCQVMIGRSSSIEIQGPGATVVNVDGSFKLGNGSLFVPGMNTPTPVLNVGGSRLKVGAQAVLEAQVSAPNAKMSLGRSARISGTFCADKLNTDANAVLECVP